MSIQLWLNWLGAFLLLWSPGYLLGRWLAFPQHPDHLVRLATHLCIGIACWPLLFLWGATFGWQWTMPVAAAVPWLLALLAIVTAAHDFWRFRRPRRLPKRGVPDKALFYAVLAILFLLSAFVRLYQIRNLVLPAWVDSVHHTAIVRLLVEQGTLPATYAPYAPDTPFFYHWGFHAIIAWCAWALQQTQPLQLAQLVLHLGQFFNLLAVLMIYAGARLLTGSRHAGLYAALFVGVVSWFPMYYVAWGRYTELAGLLPAPILLYRTWRLPRQPTAGATILVALLGAGLFLTHVRVTVFVLVGCLILALWLAPRDWKALLVWLPAAGLAVLMVAPWLTHLLAAHELQQRMGLIWENGGLLISSRNPVSWNYLLVRNNRELMAIASAGLSALFTWRKMATWGRLLAVLCFLLTAYACYQQPRSARQLLRRYVIFSVYLLALALTLNLNWIGLRTLGFVTNNSALLAAFLPLTILAGSLCGWVFGAILPAGLRWPTAFLVTVIIGTAGAWQMRSIVPPTTVLATAADLAAYSWIDQHLPPDAKFAVNVQPWIGSTYVGTDGGYWIPLLTNRRSILPIALYTANGTSASLAHTNALLAAWVQHDAVDEQLLQLLSANGVTHIYIGQQRSNGQVEKLTANRALRQIYAQNGVYLFALTGN